ncbi:unnamed protein product [Ascophyllum nodosum]
MPVGEKIYDVTACPLHLCPSFVGRTTLKLEEEEAVMISDCFLGCHKISNRPYGELGSVEEQTCFCCIGFKSNLSDTNEQGVPQAIVPGCCCEMELVREIVSELKARMKGRGDTGNIRRAEENASKINHLHAKIDAIMAQLQIPPVPEAQEIEKRP